MRAEAASRVDRYDRADHGVDWSTVPSYVHRPASRRTTGVVAGGGPSPVPGTPARPPRACARRTAAVAAEGWERDHEVTLYSSDDRPVRTPTGRPQQDLVGRGGNGRQRAAVPAAPEPAPTAEGEEGTPARRDAAPVDSRPVAAAPPPPPAAPPEAPAPVEPPPAPALDLDTAEPEVDAEGTADAFAARAAGASAAAALVRPDRLAVIDANPDAGSLAGRVALQPPPATLSDLLANEASITRAAEVWRYLIQHPSRLDVLAAPLDPAVTRQLGEAEYGRALELLTRFYSIIYADLGTALLAPATSYFLRRRADQVILVSAPSLDAGRIAGFTLDHLVVARGAEWCRRHVI